MKKFLFHSLFAITLITFGCKEKSHEHDHGHDAEAGDAVEANSNQALYNEVMKIHDEVMPKMNDIHKRKQELKNQIANTPDITEDQKKAKEATIAKLDSAGESMMIWMREFNPIPDSAGEEKAREYLENEMERVKKVRANILEALKETEPK